MKNEVFTKRKSYKIYSDFLLNKIKNRKALYLDMNVWIDIVEEKLPIFKQLKATLLNLANDGVVFCPLSAPLIWELYKQDFPSQLRVAKLMETLSLNVSFAITEEVFFWEMVVFMHKMLGEESTGIMANKIYVPVTAYLSSHYQLLFPAEWPESHISTFERVFSGKLSSLSLIELIKMRGNSLGNHLKRINTSRYSNAVKKLWETTRGNKKKISRVKEEAIARQYILPFLKKLPLELKIPFTAYLKSLPKDQYGGCMKTILESLPAIKNHTEIMAIASLDPKRKDKPSDFFDLDMMAIPLAYADVFVSQDKWIRDLLINRGTILKRNTCQYFSNLPDFERSLKTMY